MSNGLNAERLFALNADQVIKLNHQQNSVKYNELAHRMVGIPPADGIQSVAHHTFYSAVAGFLYTVLCKHAFDSFAVSFHSKASRSIDEITARRDPVSLTLMGDRLWADKPSRYVTRHPG